MIVTISDLEQTTLYPEVITEITRNNPAAALAQIEEAEDLCKTYLCKYDLTAIFGNPAPVPASSAGGSAPTVSSPFLNGIIKTIATYHLLRQAAPNIDIEIWRDEFDLVIKQLEQLRDGQMNLPGVPYASQSDPKPDYATESVSWESNPKRNNFF